MWPLQCIEAARRRAKCANPYPL